MRRYLVVVEKSAKSYCAYAPDLPGCVAVGRAAEEAQERLAAAIEMHLEGLKTDGLAAGETPSLAAYLLV